MAMRAGHFLRRLIGANLAAETERVRALMREARAERDHAPGRSAALLEEARDRLEFIAVEGAQRRALQGRLLDGRTGEDFGRALVDLPDAALGLHEHLLRSGLGSATGARAADIRLRLLALERERLRREALAADRFLRRERARLDEIKREFGSRLAGLTPAQLAAWYRIEQGRVERAREAVHRASEPWRGVTLDGAEQALRTAYARRAALRARMPVRLDRRVLHDYADALKPLDAAALRAEERRMARAFEEMTTGAIRGSREEIAMQRARMAIVNRAIARLGPARGPKLGRLAHPPEPIDASPGEGWRAAADTSGRRGATDSPTVPAPVTHPAPAGKPVPAKTPDPARRAAPATGPAPAGKPVPAAEPDPAGRSDPATGPAPAGKPVPAAKPDPAGRSAPATGPAPAGKPVPAETPDPAGRSDPATKTTPATKAGASHPAAGAPVWKEPGVFVWHAGAFPADIALQRLKALGIKWVALQIADGLTVNAETEQALAAGYIQRLRAAGIKVGFWGVNRTEPEAEAKLAADLVRKWGADFYIANAEIEYKYTSQDGSPSVENWSRSRRWVETFRKELPDIAAGLSSYGRADLADLDWKAWRDAGFDWLPQAYLNEFDINDPALCVEGAMKVGWPRDRVHPTLGLWGGGQSRVVPVSEYVASLRRSGSIGFSSYLAEQMSEEDWQNLGEAIAKGGLTR